MKKYEKKALNVLMNIIEEQLTIERERADNNYEVAKFFEQQYFMLLVETGKISANEAREALGLPSLEEVING